MCEHCAIEADTVWRFTSDKVCSSCSLYIAFHQPSANVDIADSSKSPAANVDIADSSKSPAAIVDIADSSKSPAAIADIADSSKSPAAIADIADSSQSPAAIVDIADSSKSPAANVDIPPTALPFLTTIGHGDLVDMFMRYKHSSDGNCSTRFVLVICLLIKIRNLRVRG